MLIVIAEKAYDKGLSSAEVCTFTPRTVDIRSVIDLVTLTHVISMVFGSG